MSDGRDPIPSGKSIMLDGKEYVICGEPIGRGASCLVYEAKMHGENGHRVILKEFYPADFAGIISRGENEVSLDYTRCQSGIDEVKLRFKQGVKHQVHFYEKNQNNAMMGYPDIYEANGTIYSIIGYAKGKTLDQCRDELTLCEIAQIMWSLTTAVSDFHEEDLLYLDIKPSNLFIYQKHNTYRVGFFDFDSVLPDSDKTRNGDFRPRSEFWCPPEQRQWNSSLGKQSDIFSIGAVFYWLISDKEAEDGWLDEVHEGVQYDHLGFLGEFSKLKGFINATEATKKIITALLIYDLNKRLSDEGKLICMLKNLEKLAETSKENQAISDMIQELSEGQGIKRNEDNLSNRNVFGDGMRNINQKTTNIQTLIFNGDINF
jgi:serine/threonine protein kinase